MNWEGKLFWLPIKIVMIVIMMVKVRSYLETKFKKKCSDIRSYLTANENFLKQFKIKNKYFSTEQGFYKEETITLEYNR